MLSYILFDKSLFRNIRAETSLAYKHGELDVKCLTESCPRLEAAYQETMRVTNNSLSARKIVAPTSINGKVLQSGNTILIPFRQLHYNKSVFDDPDHFDPERFLKNKGLSSCSSFKPFGGGVNYCPGRFIAKREMLVFVALALNRFKVELSSTKSDSITPPETQTLPAIDFATPSLGIPGPLKGSDVYINLEKGN